MAVAQRAATLLVGGGARRILDVGAGAGKFCITAAAHTSATVHGIERSAPLVEAARQAARRLGIDRRVRFVCGDISLVDWSRFEAFYLFNPFAEPVRTPRGATGQEARLDADGSAAYIRWVRAELARARPGTRVVTYYGFGGGMPDGYERILSEPAGTDRLELWIQR